MRPRGLLIVLCAMHACSPGGGADPESASTEPGRLVIIGGALQSDNAEVYRSVVEAREGSGPLCVIPTASADAEGAMAGAVETLEQYSGAGSATGVLLSVDDPSRARDPSVALELEACSGFYFTGGVQSRIVDVFLPAGDTTEAYRALHSRWRAGAVVAGSSAGAAMMSTVMISGGSSAAAVANGVAATPDAEGVRVIAGMGFFAPLLDQHFLARGRIGRLLVAVIAEELSPIGLGIDENTALVVDGDSAVVVGASGVVVVDGRTVERSGARSATGLKVSLAGAGDVIDTRSWEVRRAVQKVALPLRDGGVATPEDPFARWAFLHLVHDLAATGTADAVFSLDGATLSIAEAPGFSSAMSQSTGGVEDLPAGLSAGPFIVDLTAPGS